VILSTWPITIMPFLATSDLSASVTWASGSLVATLARRSRGDRVVGACRSAAGAMAAMRRRAGRSVEIRDALIAGIVSGRKATLATGNRNHFEGCDIRIVDPWSS